VAEFVLILAVAVLAWWAIGSRFLQRFGATIDPRLTQPRAQEERFHMLLNTASECIIVVDKQNHIVFANPALQTLFGYTPREMVGSESTTLMAQTEREGVREAFKRMYAKSNIGPVWRASEGLGLRKDGTTFPIEVTASAMLVEGERLLAAFIRDVSERAAQRDLLKENEERFRSLTELSSDWYWEQDEQFRFTHISGGFGETLGEDSRQLIGKCRWDLPGNEVFPGTWDAHRVILEKHEPFRDVVYRAALAGATRYVSISGRPMFDSDGRFKGYRGVGRDITAHYEAEQRLWHAAHYDDLTGLPNRTLLVKHLDEAVARAKAAKYNIAVYYIDLDRFKHMNETLGHELGDQILRNVSMRLREALPGNAFMARAGGDEFVVVLEGIGAVSDVTAISRNILTHLAKPFSVANTEYAFTASIGISMYPEDGADSLMLVKHADTALYRAKDQGKNTHCFYSPHMTARSTQRMSMEAALRRAIDREELVLHYQPKLELRANRVCGAEVLLRWKHPDAGLLGPDAFIPLAEETGLIVPIGKWVLDQVVSRAALWHDMSLPTGALAINLSARQFEDGDFLDEIKAMMQHAGLNGLPLELEVTESTLMRFPERTIDALTELSEMGVMTSVDDFGTGYSSLAYLKRLPVRKIKIDREFIQGVPADANDVAITQAILVMAHALGLIIVAEGVETNAQLGFLRAHGCDEIQGYRFSKPLIESEFVEFVRTRSAIV
jgi:diguanylate cyclase (GGDEF)-like protein/PAS domain S-box-containing protein